MHSSSGIHIYIYIYIYVHTHIHSPTGLYTCVYGQTKVGWPARTYIL